ncbi:MAG TPA: DMT family transporter [Acidimicrobiales bacterium]|nr:DMT family transporter [Acidimicrobiales bacterium]
MTRRGWAYFVAVGILWGLPYLLIRISVREISPPLLVLIRTGGASLVLVPLAASRSALLPALRHWRAILLFTLAELAVPWVFLFGAERRLPSSLTGLLVAAVPLVAAVVAWLTGSDHVDLRRTIGLVVGLAGVGVLVGFSVAGAQLLSVLSILAVVVGYAFGPWIVDHKLHGVPPIGVIAWSMVLCGAGYAPWALLELPKTPLATSVVESAAALTVVCTIVAFLLFFALIKEVGAMRATLVTYLNPAVAVVLGVLVLGEPFGPATGAGFVLILGGCLLASRPPRSPRSRSAGRDPGSPGDGGDPGMADVTPQPTGAAPGAVAVP